MMMIMMMLGGCPWSAVRTDDVMTLVLTLGDIKRQAFHESVWANSWRGFFGKCKPDRMVTQPVRQPCLQSDQLFETDNGIPVPGITGTDATDKVPSAGRFGFPVIRFYPSISPARPVFQ
ncbi:hypothetical protein ZHAS_00012388 [Anopheles sinensis]|uniref:Secreted protein n=1 Tax=Anopheles sinensis TaxID=74873 RepID=A0A084W2R7_ANOSI|nr:hypothetical protein ZHAS_00012388 [Anopheles sinensis]